MLLILLLLVSCSNRNPLITEELKSVTIQCMGSDELLEITDEKMLKKILKEINSSRREGTQEMEFPESHNGTMVTGSGVTLNMSLFDNSKLLVEDFYIHADLPDFCGK